MFCCYNLFPGFYFLWHRRLRRTLLRLVHYSAYFVNREWSIVKCMNKRFAHCLSTTYRQ
jgi:hypothetical protein